MDPPPPPNPNESLPISFSHDSSSRPPLSNSRPSGNSPTHNSPPSVTSLDSQTASLLVGPHLTIDYKSLKGELTERYRRIKEEGAGVEGEENLIKAKYMTSHKMYNMLQMREWIDEKSPGLDRLIVDTRLSQDMYNKSHIRFAKNITSYLGINSLLGKFDLNNIENSLTIILYGGAKSEEDPATNKLANEFSRRIDRIKDIYILKDSFEDFKGLYPYVCVDSQKEMNPLLNNILFLSFPLELIKGKVYVSLKKNFSPASQLLPKLMNIDIVIDVSTSPLLSKDSVQRLMEEGTGYVHMDPGFIVLPVSVPQSVEPISHNIYIKANLLYEYSTKIDGMLEEGKKLLLASFDNDSLPLSLIAAHQMVKKKWGMNTAVAFILSYHPTCGWPPFQLEELRALEGLGIGKKEI